MRSEFEEKAIFALTQHGDSPYKLMNAFVIPNCSRLGHECDVLVIQKSRYVTEIELKATISDLKADKKKRHKHESRYIRQLYFGLHEDIPYEAALPHIPETAGIMVFSKINNPDSSWHNSYHCTIIRRPKPNRDAIKIDDKIERDLYQTMYYRYYNLLFEREWYNINHRNTGQEG